MTTRKKAPTKASAKKKTTRRKPTKFELKRDEILERLANGETLRAICAAEDMPTASAVCQRALNDTEFSTQYARARETGYHIMVEDMLAIADDGSRDWTTRYTEKGEEYEVVNHEHISRSRMRFEARRWLVSKALPKIYGDKIAVEHSGTVEHKHRSAAELEQELASLGVDPSAIILTTETHQGTETVQ